MSGLVSASEFERLASAGVKKTFETNAYLRNNEDPNFQWIRDAFFDGDKSKTALFNTGSGIFSAVSSTTKYYVGVPEF